MIATCYHLRDTRGVKVLGGSLNMGRGPKADLNQAAESLVNQTEIRVMPSGRLAFFHNDKPVSMYLSIEPSETLKGKEILRAHLAKRERLRAAEEARRRELDDLVDELG